MGPHYVHTIIHHRHGSRPITWWRDPSPFIFGRKPKNIQHTAHQTQARGLSGRGVSLDEGRVKVIEASLGWQTLFKPRSFKSTSAGTHTRVLKRSNTLLVVHQKFFQTHAFDSFFKFMSMSCGKR